MLPPRGLFGLPFGGRGRDGHGHAESRDPRTRCGERPAKLSDEVEAQLRARQVDAVLQLTSPLMIVILCNVSAFVLVLRATGQLTAPILAWAALTALHASIALYGTLRNRRKAPPRTTSKRARRRMVVNSLVFGLFWAVPGVTFIPGLTGFAEIFAYTLLTGMLTGGAFGLYPIPAAAAAFMMPVAIGGVLGLTWSHGLLALGPAATVVMFLFIFRQVILRHAELFTAEFIGRLELERRNRLIEDLLEDARHEVLGTRRMMEERIARSEKMDAIGQLTGGIAHNFNNLLTAIQGHAELLALEGKADPTLIAPILNGCRAGANQVQRLLSIAGKQILRPEAVPLDAMLDGLVKMVEPSLGPAYRIRTSLADGVPAPYVDRAQLEGALLSLIFNARDAMPGGGEITVTCREAPERGGTVDISVTDTGVGMDAATRDRATEPFFTTKPIGEATGLGLSSVAGFVRQSRGTFDIQTEPGKGTTVSMCLPATPPPKRREPAAEDPAAAEADSATVLVVEDMSDVRRVTVSMLQTLGYRVVEAAGPKDAMQALDAEGAGIDLVLTDILLSDDITGLQLAKEIRRKRPSLPTIFVSGWSRQDDRLEDGSGSRVLPKPFTRQQLALHVEEALSEQRRSGAN